MARKGGQVPPNPPKRTWLKQRSNESRKQYHKRTNHSCYACGEQFADMSALDAHEAKHR